MQFIKNKNITSSYFVVHKMASESPLYSPCIAAHTPLRLEEIAASQMASMLVDNSVPKKFRKSELPSSMQNWNELCSAELDKYIVGSSEDQELFKNQFKRMKHWWEKNTCFGPFGGRLRSIVQERVTCLLEHIDYYSYIPLFIFTCQLCYTKQAGIFNQNEYEIIVKVVKRDCEKFAAFLESLGLFKIEQLLNSHMIFGDPNPLVVVVKNSPFLKSLSLRYNSCDYVMTNVGMYCSKLERFVIEDFFGRLCVSEKYLYKTFFGGRSKQEVKSNSIEASDISFPNLCQLDVGKGKVATEFLCYVNYHYPRLRSVSCNSKSHFASDMMATSAVHLETFKFYKFEDICVTTEEDIFSSKECLLFKKFPNLKHITITLDAPFKPELIESIEEKLTTVLSRIPWLTLHLPFISMENDDLNKIFAPLFLKMGSNVRMLQFFIFRSVRAELIYALINSCANLESLTIRCSADLMDMSGLYNLKISDLSNLKSFSLIIEEKEESNLAPFLASVEKLLVQAPSIVCLELVLPAEAQDWVVNAVARGYFNHVSKFLLFFHSQEDVIDVDFYVVLIEGMTSLKQLILMETTPSVLTYLKQVFASVQLRISGRKKNLIVACNGFHSKCIL